MLDLEAIHRGTAPYRPRRRTISRFAATVAAFLIENQVERMRTKRGCFVATGCDEPRYTDTSQLPTRGPLPDHRSPARARARRPAGMARRAIPLGGWAGPRAARAPAPDDAAQAVHISEISD